DNDGNAEIVVGSNTALGGRCNEDGSDPQGPNGLRVFGDPTDTWVSARRVWNEQSYHVTNVTEGGGIPTREASSWLILGGRSYNTYRSQPRSFGVAPDLVVSDIAISSPDAMCGMLSETITIAFQVENIGDLRVGPGIIVRFEGDFGSGMQQLLDDQ